MNQVFFIIVALLIFCLIGIGELWIHQKADFLFPRYMKLMMTSREQGESYVLTENEKKVLVKFGRRLVMLSLSVLLFCTLLMTITSHIPLNYGIVLLIVLFFILFYHYHLSFKD